MAFRAMQSGSAPLDGRLVMEIGGGPAGASSFKSIPGADQATATAPMSFATDSPATATSVPSEDGPVSPSTTSFAPHPTASSMRRSMNGPQDDAGTFGIISIGLPVGVLFVLFFLGIIILERRARNRLDSELNWRPPTPAASAQMAELRARAVQQCNSVEPSHNFLVPPPPPYTATDVEKGSDSSSDDDDGDHDSFSSSVPIHAERQASGRTFLNGSRYNQDGRSSSRASLGSTGLSIASSSSSSSTWLGERKVPAPTTDGASTGNASGSHDGIMLAVAGNSVAVSQSTLPAPATATAPAFAVPLHRAPIIVAVHASLPGYVSD
ncbi:hypothetical protein BC831DRAFT_441017 [Entophlyctis helioformis]|nr:hypothetical protein BC831DRAFT_441017 [Entophlyctis helioformis]